MLITDWLGWLQARLESSLSHLREQQRTSRHELHPPEPRKQRGQPNSVRTGKKGRPRIGKVPAQPRHYWRSRQKVA